MESLPITQDTNPRHYRRQLVVRFSELGLSQTDIAEGLGCSQGLVSQVLSTYEEEGADALEPVTHPGPEPGLSEEDLSELESCLREGASAFGYAQDYWDRKRVRQLIKERFGHSYTLQHISNLLDKIGFT
tara:strand:- start:211 stop:600 length:390 start_codon:yes stop_codon:yes gene_type:complete